ncbi:huntingtin-interacting protein 1-like isoform X2 [Acanthaster planci]|uniref:Huntingtin-interacting protein 1-like isoform X2 n=1 Tax=Acanthaster planci TaxID=133434 RepID=A0A8B7ZVA9_ACAPL|nr:huntingtin-interacting protein 1-like isoform X2 [Acanthaster planci]
MAGRLSTRRSGDSLEAERQNFIKQQTISVSKAINAVEVPVKEKHARSIIIGSFTDKGLTVFWAAVLRLPLQTTSIMCWKFCHTLHKVIRDGHQNVMKDCQPHAEYIGRLGTSWSHHPDGYGRLVGKYCQLLTNRLEFHKKHPLFPGDLKLASPEADLEKMAQNDINAFFQMSVEIFDHMDALIALEEAVFSTFNLARSLSVAPNGQCRLAPLIQVILDSGLLYDYSVRLLFKLHACLPADTLEGHRTRFLKQFRTLKTFFQTSSNLIYFRNLIQVPSLPDEPPNFFLAAKQSDTYIDPAIILQTMESSTDGSIKDSPPPSVFSEPIFEDFPPRQEEPLSSTAMLLDFSSPQQNGQTSSPQPPTPQRDERDFLIEQLQQEIEELKFELDRIQREDQRIINDLKKRILHLEEELHEHRRLIENSYQENEDLQTKLKEESVKAENLVASAALTDQLEEAEKRARVNEDKFRKMKDVYGKLREEHVTLLRSNADVTKQLNTVMKMTEESQLAKLNAEKFVEQLQQSVEEKSAAEDRLKGKMAAKQKLILVGAIEEAEQMIRQVLTQIDDPAYSTATCTAEYLLTRSDNVDQSLNKLQKNFQGYIQNKDSELNLLIRHISSFSYTLGEYILQGKATSNMAPLNFSEGLSSACKSAGERSLALLETLKDDSQTDGMNKSKQSLEEALKEIIRIAKELLPQESDNQEEFGDLVDQEMQATTDAVDKAAARIAEMLKKSRQADTGIKLEVNEKILDSCNDLMSSIKMLIEKSKSLQREIVAEGRGTASAGEFYKRHHRWTEGLISAAKLVGVGATHLVDASDKLMQGKGKFEELEVCSHEIAACTAQLVAASKVKANRESENLKGLQGASREVASSTAAVVASAKTGAQLIEEGDVNDFTKLSLTQTKRYEMDAQVAVLELESKLEKERVKLAELRKRHYQLAGASEGWDDENIAHS